MFSYNRFDGLKFISHEINPYKDNLFKIKPNSGLIIMMKKIGNGHSTKYNFGTQVIYKKKNLIDKVMEEGAKELIKVGDVTYPDIAVYSGFFGGQYASVYVNDHDTIAIKVFVKFGKLKN